MPALPAREMRVCLCMCMPVSLWVCLCVCVRAGPQVGGCPRRAFVAVGQEHRRPGARACAQCPLRSIWAAEWQWALELAPHRATPWAPSPLLRPCRQSCSVSPLPPPAEARGGGPSPAALWTLWACFPRAGRVQARSDSSRPWNLDARATAFSSDFYFYFEAMSNILKSCKNSTKFSFTQRPISVLLIVPVASFTA